MNEYRIMTDSSADIPQEHFDRDRISIIPMPLQVNGEDVVHESPCGWESKAFYERLRGGATGNTSQIPPAVYVTWFEEVLKEGKDILYISLSGGLSATWQSASLAAAQLLEKYPERRIACVDSRAATGGQGLLVIYGLENQKNGMSLEENARWLEENRNRICHWFTVDDLDFLKRGGRISPTIAWIGGKLKIKPVLRIQEDGTLSIMEKVRGAKAAAGCICKKYLASGYDSEHPYVLICHGDAEEQAEGIKEEILLAIPQAKVYTMPMGPVIGIHTGPGVQAVIYFGNNR
ncbi:MAG: DegV family protein [Eubacteriales bacterium]|nr:DegV family protein [Eubacteriales bacterium]